MNYLLLMAGINGAKDFCETLTPVWTVFGYIIFGVKVIVPLLLIITGMVTLAKAVMSKKDDEINKAKDLLIKKIIIGVAVFLVIQIVSVVIGLVGDNASWKKCAACALHPFTEEYHCRIVIDTDDDVKTDEY